LAERKRENNLRKVFESFIKQPLAFKITISIIITIIFAAIIGIPITVIVLGLVDFEEGIAIISILSLLIIVIGFMIPLSLIEEFPYKQRRNRRKERKRRKQIREAGLDQLEDGEQALSSEELEERYNQRQAQRPAMAQNNVRRRPPIVLLNERPSNEKLLKKMIFKGKITGEKCSICKLDLRKKQTIVQCPKCLALFHYDHMNNWFEKNNDCPVCDELLVK